MEFYQLRSFVTIAQTGSFTKAAEKLFVTQSALSQQIKALEQNLEMPLFERDGRTIRLTEPGGILLERATQMLDLEAQIDEEMGALAGLERGRLRIGTSDTTCLYLLPPVLQRFRNAYPAIEIHLTNRPSSEVIASLDRGEIDFGIVTLASGLRRYQVEELFLREDVAICPAGHPLSVQTQATLAELSEYPLLLLEKGSTSRAYLDQLFDADGIRPRITDLGSIEVIKRYVEIDLGVSIIPKMSVLEEVEAGRLHAIELPWLPSRAVGWIQRPRAILSSAGREFQRMLLEAIQNSPELERRSDPAGASDASN